MQATPFYINEKAADIHLIETELSFTPLTDYLRKRMQTENTIKARLYEYVLEHFNIKDKLHRGWASENANEYLYELIYSTLSPVLLSENENYWALSTAIPNQVLYSTDAFYQLLHAKGKIEFKSSIVTDNKFLKRQQEAYVYRLILKKYYDFTSALSNDVYYSYFDEQSDSHRYFRIHIDTTFIDVEVDGDLPELDFETIESYLHGEEGLDVLAGALPLNKFKLKGFSIITLEDVTAQRAIDEIRRAIAAPVHEECDLYKDVTKWLRTLTENMDVNFGLLPFFKLNGDPVFDAQACSESVLIQSAKKWGNAEDTFKSLVDYFEHNPYAVFFSSISETRQRKFFFLKVLNGSSIKSYGVIPLLYHKNVVGIMEIYSERELLFYENLLSRLDFAVPHITQLLKNSLERFDARIASVIMQRFTSLQPAVQWKFNETAWNCIKNPGLSHKSSLSNITFKDVYPLYGAVDIRNSTIERNLALQNDLKRVFALLLRVLKKIAQHEEGQLWADLIEKAAHWEQVISEHVNTGDEMLINQYLEDEAATKLKKYKSGLPAGTVDKDVDNFLDMIERDCEGPAFTQRNRLESSMQLINTSVNQYFEKAQSKLQELYPCYFEKIRTDGVEYDVYVGQSITPKMAFDQFHLRQMRLWQLTSMVEVARLTRRLQEQMPAILETTQLIFIHSMPIDISFRNDERRFDVEGAYNIRYEIIKKRIDKVLLLNSTERLTQPGKIAIVFFTDQEAEEQQAYIQQLQKQQLLLPEVEHLDLEELQGVKGLKALRVSINYDAKD